MQQNQTTQIAKRPTTGLSVRQVLSSMTLQHSTQSASVSKQAVELRCLYPKPSALLAEYSTDLQGQVGAACPTVDLCRQIPSPTLSVLAEAYPANGAVSAVSVFLQSHLAVVCAYADTKSKMDADVLADLCQQIAAEHCGLTMIEFVLFCNRFRSKRYGDFYGSVAPSHILAALNTFEGEKRFDQNEAYGRELAARMKCEAKERSEKSVTWEEYCKMKGKDPKTASVFLQPCNKNQQKAEF